MTEISQGKEFCPNREDFYFDDEPLEQLLYGTGGRPSPASIFSATRERIWKAQSCLDQDQPQEALKEISELSDPQYRVVQSHLAELAGILGHFIPLVPCPALDWDLRIVGPLLDRMWSLERGGPPFSLGDTIGQLHFRQHEHLEQYEEARQVMAVLIEQAKAPAYQMSLAINTNNYAVEYLLEKRWAEAFPLFEQALQLMSGLGYEREWAAVRANYLHCRLEIEGQRIGPEIEPELHTLRQIQVNGHDWRERKVLILLARVHEAQGDLAGATAYVERAVQVGANTNTRWPEIDGRYLAKLRQRAEWRPLD